MLLDEWLAMFYAPWSHNKMRYSHFIGLSSILLTLSQNVSGQDFANLNFEQAQITSAPSGYTPGDAFLPISAASALPYWTVREDSVVCTAIWGAPVALDETSVALLTAINGGSPGYVPLQGGYSLQLYAFADAPSGYFHNASISQTGLLPSGARSIQFLMQSPPVAGGFVQANPIVTLNGMAIALSPLSVSGGVMTMAGDISAYAGTSVDLTILCQATPGGSPANENIFTLDDIRFSPQPLPEPHTGCLLLVGAVFIWFWFTSRRERRGYDRCITCAGSLSSPR